LAEKLKEMNPFASVMESQDEESFSTLLSSNTFSAVVCGFNTFKEAIKVNKACRGTDTPFYTLNSSGLYGFFYIDLGSSFKFSYTKKATETEKTEIITESKTVERYLEPFSEAQISEPLSWNKRTIFRHDKYLFLAIAAKFI
jgi:molybdopterin/thiamine biosynthesis adenylyltransferase